MPSRGANHDHNGNRMSTSAPSMQSSLRRSSVSTSRSNSPDHHDHDSNPESDDDLPAATIREDDPKVYAKLGFCYPTWYKWYILTVIFIIQCSMNFNAGIYGNAVPGLQDQFGISAQAARVGQMIFLIAYGFGCELWAPWSEEFGRRTILQLSLFFVNLWQIPCALAPNFGTIVVCRFLGGLSSAGGSVTLGMVADMWEPEHQQYAVAYVVFSSVGGSVIAPVVGGFVQQSLHWRWVFWLQLIFGGFVQILHFFTVNETRSSVLVNRYAQQSRKDGDSSAWSEDEIKKRKVKQSGEWNWAGLPLSEITTIWIRPFKMFLTEPIVLFLSLLSGFSDALIFTFLESYSPVYEQWGFNAGMVGLAFLPLLVGYFLAYFSFFPWFAKQSKIQRRDGYVVPEYRLKWLLYLAPLETIGLFGFAWTSIGPSYGIPWIAPMLFSALVGAANYAIYMATIDYMIAAYGPYAASATGGNGFARDLLSGIAAMYATPLYTNIKSPKKGFHLAYASTILACLAFLVAIPVYVFYIYGPRIRDRSAFANSINEGRKHHDGQGARSNDPKETGPNGRVESSA